jgi:hypothetical protein
MASSARTILGFGIGLALLVLGLALIRHHKANTHLRAVAPELAGRISAQVRQLQSESVTGSLAKLSDINMYHWPGPPPPAGRLVKAHIPLSADVGQSDLEAIMSNRRFRKSFVELKRIDRAKASEIIDQEFAAALTSYLPFYDLEMQRNAPHYKLDRIADNTVITGPTFAVGNAPQGEEVIAGLRLKILGMVWIVGSLGLTDNKALVERVADLAVKQRAELYNDPTLHPFFRVQMLERASLYNRQLISSAFLGLVLDPRIEASVLKAVGCEWQERTLGVYASELTEFDLPVRSGVMKPDYSRGSFSVKFLPPLNDAQFDLVLSKLELGH